MPFYNGHIHGDGGGGVVHCGRGHGGGHGGDVGCGRSGIDGIDSGAGWTTSHQYRVVTNAMGHTYTDGWYGDRVR